MASGLRVAQRNELDANALRLVSIRSSRTAIEIRYIRLKASSSKQTCFSNSSTRRERLHAPLVLFQLELLARPIFLITRVFFTQSMRESAACPPGAGAAPI